jgi:hypothetical protein
LFLSVFKLNYAALKPNVMNERMSDKEFTRWSWSEASGMSEASKDTQRILFE